MLLAVLALPQVPGWVERSGAAEVPPIALGNSAVARQLQEWWAEGTAAGNIGDFYDNRDRLHSNLQVRQLFPQLTRVEYTTNEVKLNRDFGPATRVHLGVTVGNSSTARAATEGGGNARSLYARADGLDLLHGQYRGNNLYVYPEHQDHDAGWNGHEGYGDLIPANTPYLLVSQGSSTSDLPFVRAAVYTLAAFRPETKKRLTDAGLLMPTLQMLFRWCATNVASEAEYLSGKAHPTAFDPSAINTLRMCGMAHDIQPDNLPPLAQIEVVREDRSKGGVDSFDTSSSELIGDSPGAVARLWRSSAMSRRLVINAQGSIDPQKRPLKFHWTVLRGDTNQVEIRPMNEASSIVEIRVGWPRRRPVVDGASLESNRLDIGLFVHNGTWWSPPAFVTWFASDREARTVDERGRLVDIGYFAGSTFLELAELGLLVEWLKAEPRSAQATAFAQMLGPAETALLLQDASAAVPAEVSVSRARTARLAADKEFRTTQSALRQADAASRKSTDPFLAKQAVELRQRMQKQWQVRKDAEGQLQAALAAVPETAQDARSRMVGRLREWMETPDLASRSKAILDPLLSGAVASARQKITNARARLLGFGLEAGNDDWSFRGILGDGRWTECERQLMTEFNVTWFIQLLAVPGLELAYEARFMDSNLFAPKPWRDVYRYDESGTALGWRRYSGGASPAEFSADGLLVSSKDATGRPLEAVDVVYQRAPQPGLEGAAAPVSWKRGSRAYVYLYDGPEDVRGRPLESR
ncbi:MAG: hypothetical protein JNK85_13100 [Verrucomicrobiales bacterium]|nr:hypothetical protein [Verrucomicrobiales bacterium]